MAELLCLAKALPGGPSQAMMEGTSYPAWSTYTKLLNMAIEIVSFPMKNGTIFQFVM